MGLAVSSRRMKVEIYYGSWNGLYTTMGLRPPRGSSDGHRPIWWHTPLTRVRRRRERTSAQMRASLNRRPKSEMRRPHSLCRIQN